MRASVAARTDVGRVRKGNEDSYLVSDPLFAVADGMGGHLAGEIASATAIEAITEGARADAPKDTSALAALVREANAAIWDRAQGDPNLRGMGTTCTLVMLDGGELHIAHVGDSRAYLFRSGELSQLTEDHTLVGRMVREGRLSPEEAERHPQRSIITRALGVDAEVEVDELTIGVEPGDRVLLCSDGLTSMIDVDELHNVLAGEGDGEAAVSRLVDAANEAGGEDNVTVVLVDIVDDDGNAPTGARVESTTPGSSARHDTDPDAPPLPPAVDTGVHRAVDPAEAAPAPTTSPATMPETEAPASSVRGWGRRLAASLVVLVLLGAAAVGAQRYTLSTSYFIGADGNGTVTIYRGIPDDILWMKLKEPEERTDVSLDDLPGFLRGDVEEGIRAESLSDARTKVAALQERARDADFEKSPTGGNS